MYLLSVENLSVSFTEKCSVGKKASRKHVLQQINLQIFPGEVFILAGESGSGKSLTALAIGKLLPTSAHVCGNILFNGIDLNRLTEKELRKIRGLEISYIFQEPMSTLNPLRRIGFQLIECICRCQKFSKNEAYAIAIKNLQRLHFSHPEELLHCYPFQLSGGMQQRVGIAMAICTHPKLLIADEPTTALDNHSQNVVLNLLQELQKIDGFSLLLITHNLHIAKNIAHRIAIIDNGKIVETNITKEIFQNPHHQQTRRLLNAFFSFRHDR
jgi:ABC-type dipeptide/oligopeptide/nickel transport system ATPase component